MIGVFDSGIGGFTVVRKIFEKLPSLPIIYFGDTAHLPYGTKSPDAIKKYSVAAVKFLKEKGADIIVIACNTSSAVAMDVIIERNKHMPIFDMITPTVDYILEKKYKKIGLIGTPTTINSGIYNKLLNKRNKAVTIYPVACPLLVPLIEEGWLKNKVMDEVLKYYLSSYEKKNIEALVLGCTHYPLIKNQIKKRVGKGIEIINPADAVIQDVKKFISDKKYISNGSEKAEHKFYVSDEPYKFKKQAKMFLKRYNPIIEKIILNN